MTILDTLGSVGVAALLIFAPLLAVPVSALLAVHIVLYLLRQS